jgi:Flp pilus assembly CpaE family ATPase
VYPSPSLRLALGLGDQELEQRLRPTLDADDDVVVVAQCLAADQLLQSVESREADAAVVAWSLHRLTDAILDQLDRPGVPIVLLVPDPDDERWRGRRGPVIPVDSDAATVRQVVLAARRGGRVLNRPRPTPEPVVLKAADRGDAGPRPLPGSVIAVTGGAGSPGRTTIAINLATALGAAVPTVLVEADLCAPALAAYLDRDPSRNLCTLAHVVREDPQSWDAALSAELQPLNRHSPFGMALCGPPKREMRSSIAPAFLDRLIIELKHRFTYVVLDVGPELLGLDTAAANHRAALAGAQQVVLVAASDLVGLWHARTALDQLDRHAGIEARTVNLLLNRHDRHYHHSLSEVEWHLGAPVVGIVPFDHPATQRAIAEQRPLVADPSGRAGHALRGLAERIYAGQLQIPMEPAGPGRLERMWRSVLRRPPRTYPASPAAIREPHRLHEAEAEAEPEPEPEMIPVKLPRERRGRAR